MKTKSIIAVLLIVGGVAGFSYLYNYKFYKPEKK
jgi:hypothetical protein